MSDSDIPALAEVHSREDAFNKILASIAMEEVGLSNIISAEGEKYKNVLRASAGEPCSREDLERLTAFNKSADSLLSNIMQKQLFLKSKMERVLEVLGSSGCCCRAGETGATSATAATETTGATGATGATVATAATEATGATVTTAATETTGAKVATETTGCSGTRSTKALDAYTAPDDYIWCEGSVLPWTLASGCTERSGQERTRVTLLPCRNYSISFCLNTAVMRQNKSGLRIEIQASNTSRRRDIFTFKMPPSRDSCVEATISCAGIFVSTMNTSENTYLNLTLSSPESVRVNGGFLCAQEF